MITKKIIYTDKNDRLVYGKKDGELFIEINGNLIIESPYIDSIEQDFISPSERPRKIRGMLNGRNIVTIYLFKQ